MEISRLSQRTYLNISVPNYFTNKMLIRLAQYVNSTSFLDSIWQPKKTIMEKQKIQLNNKLVWASEPYKPNTKIMSSFVGRELEMELIMASWIAGSDTLPLSPVLVGEPGVGKNRIVYELARFTGRDLYIFQGHEDITAEDLACTVRFSDDTANLMEYVLSPLVCAMIKGGIFFLDEIGKIRPRALALLVSVLDERRYIDSTLLCERVFAHPGFRFIAATNTGEIGMLPEFIRSRMRPVIKIGHPPRAGD
jgi:MoxR-like ATPase